MEDRIHLQIVTPAEIVVDETVRYVRLPLEGGSIGVLHSHAPLIGAVTTGIVKYTQAGVDCFAAVGDGVVRVLSDEITVLVAAARRADNDDAARETVRKMKING